MKVLRIGFICNEYPPGPHGGIGTLVQTLARALVARGHAARVVGVYRRDYPAPDRENDRGVLVRRLRSRPGVGGVLFSTVALYRHCRRASRAGDVDLIEAPDWEGWIAGWPQLQCPVIVRLSGSSSYFISELGRRPGGLTFRVERAALRRADAVCAESKYVAERTREVFGLPYPAEAVIYNPVEIPEDVEPQERRKERVMFAATLTEKKGIRSLVRAWPQVVAKRADAELHVFGKDGRTSTGRSMQEDLEDELRQLGVSGVVFRGHVPLADLMKELKTARVMVLPSYAEGFSLMPLHAMACGCPTVYSRRGSGPEVIRDGRDGLLVDPDSPEEISRAILAILEDDGLAARLGEAGRQRVRERFAVDRVIEQNVRFYEECIARFSRKRGES